MDNVLLFIQLVARFVNFVLWCLFAPFLKLQAFRKRKKLPPVTNKILLLSATELAKRIRNREVSSVEVVKTFIERCKQVNPILNAIVEERFEAAMQEAQDIDNFLNTTEKTKQELAQDMPLLGLPITVKQSIAVKGMRYEVGVKTKISERANRDAIVIEMLRKAGVIIILISNTPEFSLFWETYNNVTGRTHNPYDTRRVSGGSSGGEAALLGAGASVLGVVSDIAGSIRLPAMFCGVFAHKPTALSVPAAGHRPESPETVWCQYFTIGSMVRYAEDLPLLLKVMASSPDVKKCFESKVSPQNIKIFCLETDGSYVAQPIDKEIAAAIHKLKEHMNLQGIKTEKANLSELKFSSNIATNFLLSMDCVESVFDDPNKQGWASVTLECFKCLCGMSSYTLPALGYHLLKKLSDCSPERYHKEMKKRGMRLKKQFEDLLGNNAVLISPTFTSAAYYPYETFLNVTNMNYLTTYNALGFPVTQCPLGLNSEGLPIGVQVAANAGCDHLTIAIAQEIQRAFGGWRLPPCEE